MINMSKKLLYELHTCSVKTLLFRRWAPNTDFSSSIHLNCRRNAHTTIDSKDYFQVNEGIHWDPEGPLKPLHTLNYLRVPYIRDSLVNIAPGEKFSTCLKGKKILDVGCGGGFLSEALAKLGAEVTGIDTNKEAIEHAKQHSSKNMRLANNLPTYVPVTIEASLRQLDLSLLSELWTLSEAMASWRRQLERGPRLRPAPPPPPPPHYLRT